MENKLDSKLLSSANLNNKKPYRHYMLHIAAIVLVMAGFASYVYSQYLTKDALKHPVSAAENLAFANYHVVSSNLLANQDDTRITNARKNAWLGNGQSAENSYLGMIFTGQKLDKNIEIVAAEVTFTSYSKQWIGTSQKIQLENSTNPSPFSNTNKVSNRLLMDTSKSFNDNTEWQKDQPYSYDITDIVKDFHNTKQGVPERLSLISKGTGNSWGRKYIYGTSVTNKAPVLRIQYRNIGVVPDITTTPINPTNTITTVPSPTHVSMTSITPTQMPIPSSAPDTMVSHGFGLWNPSKWDTCTKIEHDLYFVIGPDGKKYPTWHPAVHTKVDGSTCTFGHEHGRDPQGSNLVPFIKQNYNGLLFGYANERLDEFNTANNISSGMRHEDHVGHKIEWENNVTMTVNKCNGPASEGCFESTKTNITCDFLMKVHQGTHSKDAFSNNVHELAYFVQCNDGTKIAATKMVAFGKPGEFMDTCTKSRVITAGLATPQNSPTGDGVRFIGDATCINQNILVPQGQFSQYSLGLYEDWVSSNYLVTSNNQILAYFDPHFAVFSPSRYFDPSKPDNMGRSIDVCYMKEANGDRARGGECEQITNYRDGSMIPMAERITYDDPRSPMNGVRREFYFNQTWIKNVNGQNVWHTDPYGKKASPISFPGSINQWISSTDNYNTTIFESQAIGSDRYYGGSGVHAPN